MKYYSIDRAAEAVRREGAAYVLLMGGRNIGKSYQVKKKLLTDAFINGSELIYLRREKEDILTDLCQGYFTDVPVNEITEDLYDSIIVYQKKIFWARHDEEGVVTEKKLLGYTHALRLATHYKSVMYPNVTDVIFEEFVPDGSPYLTDEPLKLQEYISTIFRTRTGRCWLIGNTVSRLNPYAKAWHLDNVHKMHKHQIDTYTQTVNVQTREGVISHDVKIIVERCAAEGLLSKMAFGDGSGQIVSNEYRRYEQPTVDAAFIEQDCNILHEIYMFYQNLKFKLQLCQIIDPEGEHDNEVFWYCKPASGKIKQEDLPHSRVISDKPDYNPLHTQLKPVSGKELAALSMLDAGRVFYSDDMTGTDFKQCYRALKRRI